jgi:hypothetical protein
MDARECGARDAGPAINSQLMLCDALSGLFFPQQKHRVVPDRPQQPLSGFDGRIAEIEQLDIGPFVDSVRLAHDLSLDEAKSPPACAVTLLGLRLDVNILINDDLDIS